MFWLRPFFRIILPTMLSAPCSFQNHYQQIKPSKRPNTLFPLAKHGICSSVGCFWQFSPRPQIQSQNIIAMAGAKLDKDTATIPQAWVIDIWLYSRSSVSLRNTGVSCLIAWVSVLSVWWIVFEMLAQSSLMKHQRARLHLEQQATASETYLFGTHDLLA